MQDFAGIAEKLVRAKENIGNLDSEIEGFFQESDYPVIPQDDREATLKAIEYHKKLLIPPRFSVLSGEIIHHLRSCFDHIAWHFTVIQVKNIRKIEFPVFDERPVNHESRRLFEGKIEGITDPNVRNLIERFQPYNAPHPTDDPLWIIHDFDIVDKHRELVICAGTGTLVTPPEMREVMECYQREHPELDAAQLARDFKGHGVTQPNIAFRNFGRRKIQTVTVSLLKLFNYTISVVEEFRAL